VEKKKKFGAEPKVKRISLLAGGGWEGRKFNWGGGSLAMKMEGHSGVRGIVEE